MIRSQHRGVVLSSSDQVSGEYIRPGNASRIMRCCCSELPRPPIPSGRGFHWRQVLHSRPVFHSKSAPLFGILLPSSYIGCGACGSVRCTNITAACEARHVTRLSSLKICSALSLCTRIYACWTSVAIQSERQNEYDQKFSPRLGGGASRRHGSPGG